MTSKTSTKFEDDFFFPAVDAILTGTAPLSYISDDLMAHINDLMSTQMSYRDAVLASAISTETTQADMRAYAQRPHRPSTVAGLFDAIQGAFDGWRPSDRDRLGRCIELLTRMVERTQPTSAAKATIAYLQWANGNDTEATQAAQEALRLEDGYNLANIVMRGLSQQKHWGNE